MNVREDLEYYAKLAQRRVGFVAGQLELTSKCFQKCVACDSWRSDLSGVNTGVLSRETVINICKELDSMKTFEHLSFTGGDPQSWDGFEDLMEYIHMCRFKFTTQANTALAKDPEDFFIWRVCINRIRVSLDGVTRETYKKMRGVDLDPEEIIERIEKIKNPMLATNTCVTDINIDEVPRILERLNRMEHPPRKAMFLAAMDFKLRDEFWKNYRKLSLICSPYVETSFSESVLDVRNFLLTPKADKIRCYAGAISFHIKSNGDVYPCCLVGGEAIKTRKEMSIGNIYKNSLSEIQRNYVPEFHYKNENTPCRAVCQYKQFSINFLASKSENIELSMP